MPEDHNKRHLFLGATGQAEGFTSPKSGRNNLNLPSRQRGTHGRQLLSDLQKAKDHIGDAKIEREQLGIEEQEGFLLSFTSDPDFDLNLESLEDSNLQTELVAVRKLDGVIQATVFIPYGKLEGFEKKIRRYLEEDSKWGKPKNQRLIIRCHVFQS